MKYIDFHTHIFPDKIASRVLRILQNNAYTQSGMEAVVSTDGTCDGLRSSMKANGVDMSVVLPIATVPSQTDSINSFAKSVMSDDVISFGSVHPYQENWEEVVYNIAECGVKGIKLHPQYQEVPVDSPEVIRILKKAEELKLYTSIHSGSDIGKPPPVMCTPLMLKNVMNEVSGKYIIAAHLGGFEMWDDVEKYLVGTDILLDTAFVSNHIGSEQYKRIIRNHGADKILFASDSPWESTADTIAGLKALELTDEEYRLITHKNALRILNL